MKLLTPLVYAVTGLCIAVPGLRAVAQATPEPAQGAAQLGTETPTALSAQETSKGSNNPSALNWEQLKARFEANNPTLRADQLNVEETRAQEITAHLRPNPGLSYSLDQLYPYPDPDFRPFANALSSGSINYLWERQNKRNLRWETAKEATRVAEFNHKDMERNLLYTLRGAYVQTLQAKAIVRLSEEDLKYYDKIIEISQARFHAGDIAQVDLDRIELQRVQYEQELQTARVNLRTNKIQLLQLINEHTPIEQFDVDGTFDFSPDIQTLDEFRQTALATRPDLLASAQTIDEAKVAHKLAVSNGSTDPTLSVDAGSNPPLDPYLGFNISIPLRIFDRNQGEKKRTQIDIERSQRLNDASKAQVFNDVDSAYAQVESNITLLKPYKAKYLQQSTRVRDTITYSYQHGGASLTDLLSAQSDYRVVQLAYLQLIGTYLTAVSQLNLAVGREVIP